MDLEYVLQFARNRGTKDEIVEAFMFIAKMFEYRELDITNILWLDKLFEKYSLEEIGDAMEISILQKHLFNAPDDFIRYTFGVSKRRRSLE